MFNPDRIDFCETITYTAYFRKSYPELEGKLVDYVIHDLLLELHIKPETVSELVRDDPEKADNLKRISEVNKNGGIVFLRIDAWSEKCQMSFLLFHKEQVKIFNGLEGKALEIGMGRELQRFSVVRARATFRLNAPDNSQYIFITADSKSEHLKQEKFQLIGDDKYGTVQKGALGGWYLEKVQPRRRDRQIYGTVLLVGQKIEFVEGEAKYTKSLEEAYRKARIEDNNSEILNLWNKYSKLEEENERIDAEIYWEKKIHYTNHFVTGNRAVFYCEKLTKTQLSSIQKCSLGFAVIREKDGDAMEVGLNGKNQQQLTKKIDFYHNDQTRLVCTLENTNVSIPPLGYIVPSVVGTGIKNNRRMAARSSIDRFCCPLPSLKNIVQDGLITETLKANSVATKRIEEKLGYPLTVAQEKAIELAANTPDIALIQGPPGTGKTSVIKGLLIHLERESKKTGKEFQILVSSEAHFAVDNAVKNTEYLGMPCKRIGGKFGKENNVNEYSNWVLKIRAACEEYLKEEGSRDDYESTARLLLDSTQRCRKELVKNSPDMEELYQAFTVLYGYMESSLGITAKRELSLVEEARRKIYKNKNQSISIDGVKGELFEKLLGISEIKESPSEEQLEQLHEIRKLLRRNHRFLPDGFDEIPEYWDDVLLGDPEDDSFEKGRVLVNHDLKAVYDKLNGADENQVEDQVEMIIRDCIKLISVIEEEVERKFKSRSRTVGDAVRNFLDRVEDPDSVRGWMADYAKFSAATCQQSVSTRFGRYYLEEMKEYDYVIIDEAAKANPLDLLIPMSLGRRIILVGDHKQLPHLIEERIVKEISAMYDNDEIEKASRVNGEEKQTKQPVEKLLKESFFARLYNLLEKNNSGRTVLLDSQFRMHSEIANLVSDAFYGGAISSEHVKDEEKTHGVAVYRGKPLVWIDIPYSKENEEVPMKPGYQRICEADRAVEEARKIIQATGEQFTIGVISFYADQVELLEKKFTALVKDHPKREIKIGSVDAFQGQEFDAVILSAVRSNEKDTVHRGIGFLASEQRQNVAFSRARKLLIMIADSDTLCRFDYSDPERELGTRAFIMFKERSLYLK